MLRAVVKEHGDDVGGCTGAFRCVGISTEYVRFEIGREIYRKRVDVPRRKSLKCPKEFG